VFGRAQSLAGGTFEYSGNTYDIERGIVSFVDPLEIDPSLDLVASTRVGAYAVSLSVGGTLENLEVSFASDPPLPDLEVLALVAGGEGAAERLASAGDGGIQTGLRTQAESLLLGQAAALLERRVGTLFGLDSIQIEPLTTGGETLSSARVTVGRQINPRLRATYSWDPSSTEQQRLRVEWIAGEGWTLVLTQNGDGTYSVDSRWEQRF
jgi:translocation and assembly module TamB